MNPLKKNNHRFIITSILFSLFLASCGSDDSGMVENVPSDPTIQLSDEIEVYEADFIDENPILIIENGGTTSYLVNKQGSRLFTWEFSSNLGNDLELLPSGQVIGLFKSENPSITIGGWGGIAKIINPDGTIDWEFETSSNEIISHHDLAMLPNGNILIMLWERISQQETQESGFQFESEAFPEKIIEVNPSTNNIVWEWRMWDHIIQEQSSEANFFGDVANNPRKIDINYNTEGADLTHANGIFYDPNLDVIYLSVNHYDEIWVIDHSTTTSEAASNSGGNYGYGGDLVYRFGNPTAYKNDMGEKLFDRNHTPRLIPEGLNGEGNMLVFVNGINTGASKVLELDINEDFNLEVNTNNEPQVVWEFSNENLFNQRISGAVRLPNGNTLICEGDYGYWEVTNDKNVVWKYNGTGNFWRGYYYPNNYEGILNLNIQ